MGHGGARPGAGKPKGSVAKADAKAREKAAQSGVTPLEYLLQIMRDELQPQEDRMDAAKAAAPYVHAKLANVSVAGDPANPIVHTVRREIVRPGDPDR